MRKTFIGLSLSLCVRDILLGKIEVNQIAGIITSTAFENLHQAFAYYYPNYWKSAADANTAFKTLAEVWPLVCQPRLQAGMFENRGHYVTHGHWLDTENGKLIKDLTHDSEDNSVH